MGRNADIQQDTIHLVHTQSIQHGSEIHIVVTDDGDLITKFLQSLSCGSDGCLVLIDTDQSAALTQALADLVGMAAATQGAVHVNTVRLHLQ